VVPVAILPIAAGRPHGWSPKGSVAVGPGGRPLPAPSLRHFRSPRSVQSGFRSDWTRSPLRIPCFRDFLTSDRFRSPGNRS